MTLNISVRRALAADTLLGEGPVWDTERQVLWFVDIKRHRLWHYDPATGSNFHAEAPAPIGWALPADHGQLLCGLKDGLYLFDPPTRRFDFLSAIPGEPASNRLNDACTDPLGRVWFGSMDDAEGSASGRFYLFDRGAIRPAGPAGIAITNGPAVNAAGDRIYFTDTVGKRMMVAALGRDGIGEIRPFVDTAKDFPAAFPDGPVVDAEDHVWIGLYLGGVAARYSPDGSLIDTIALPARDITKLAFGGADYGTAYVTTATKDMQAQDMAAHPLAGSVLAFDAPVVGFAQPKARLG